MTIRTHFRWRLSLYLLMFDKYICNLETDSNEFDDLNVISMSKGHTLALKAVHSLSIPVVVHESCMINYWVHQKCRYLFAGRCQLPVDCLRHSSRSEPSLLQLSPIPFFAHRFHSNLLLHKCKLFSNTRLLIKFSFSLTIKTMNCKIEPKMKAKQTWIQCMRRRSKPKSNILCLKIVWSEVQLICLSIIANRVCHCKRLQTNSFDILRQKTIHFLRSGAK